MKADENEGSHLRVKDVALLMSEVPGRQTVPRAELWAATLAAKDLGSNQSKSGQTFTDAAYVCTCAELQNKNKGGNCDLKRLFAHAREGVRQEIRKL